MGLFASLLVAISSQVGASESHRYFDMGPIGRVASSEDGLDCRMLTHRGREAAIHPSDAFDNSVMPISDILVPNGVAVCNAVAKVTKFAKCAPDIRTILFRSGTVREAPSCHRPKAGALEIALLIGPVTQSHPKAEAQVTDEVTACTAPRILREQLERFLNPFRLLFLQESRVRR
jgi:hypothetical protein